MKPAPTHLAFAAALWLALGPMLASGGQNAAQPPSAGKEPPPGAGVLQEPITVGGSPLLPVTAEHRGRLLILTHGSKPTPGALMSSTSPRGESPRFAVYQGQRQLASGQFEYG